MEKNPLGEKTEYPLRYNPHILFPIQRKVEREKIGIGEKIPFLGYDVWNLYEVSWIKKSANGQFTPVSWILQLFIDAQSINIPESKSVKLYLNSINNEVFEDEKQVLEIISRDLKKITGIEKISSGFFDLKLVGKKDYKNRIQAVEGESLESWKSSLDKDSILKGEVLAHLIKFSNEIIKEKILYTNSLRSLCPVTGQPDWASVWIKYSGRQIDEKSLLNYIFSFRNHKGFHEQCCEEIFWDIYKIVQPEKLFVSCHFTRRGGIDINPVRFLPNSRLPEWEKSFPAFYRQ